MRSSIRASTRPASTRWKSPDRHSTMLSRRTCGLVDGGLAARVGVVGALDVRREQRQPQARRDHQNRHGGHRHCDQGGAAAALRRRSSRSAPTPPLPALSIGVGQAPSLPAQNPAARSLFVPRNGRQHRRPSVGQPARPACGWRAPATTQVVASAVQPIGRNALRCRCRRARWPRC